jgi:cob(I)alamin adenosyltransferase
MSHKILTLSLAALGLIAAGCAKKSVTGGAQWGGVGMSAMVSLVPGAGASERFIAERHKLEVVTPEQDLQKSWEETIAFCKTIRCEVMSSTITTRTGDLEPSGALTLRVVPDDLQKLLAQIQSVGQIATHTTEREDKTTAVIDTEAKLKNLTSFRDSLRGMLGKPSATVKDLVEIQQQLTDTQTELDSETAQRKVLANETEKIAVDISFRVARSSENSGAFSEIRTAFRDSGSVLADSIATLIAVIVALIPWLILIVPGLWLFVRAWRRARRNRKSKSEPITVNESQKV